MYCDFQYCMQFKVGGILNNCSFIVVVVGLFWCFVVIMVFWDVIMDVRFGVGVEKVFLFLFKSIFEVQKFVEFDIKFIKFCVKLFKNLLEIFDKEWESLKIFVVDNLKNFGKILRMMMDISK